MQHNQPLVPSLLAEIKQLCTGDEKLAITLVVNCKQQIPWFSWDEVCFDEKKANEYISKIGYDKLEESLREKISLKLFKKITALSIQNFNQLMLALAFTPDADQQVKYALLLNYLKNKQVEGNTKTVAMDWLSIIYAKLPIKTSDWRSLQVVKNVKPILLQLLTKQEQELLTAPLVEILCSLDSKYFLQLVIQWQSIFSISCAQIYCESLIEHTWQYGYELNEYITKQQETKSLSFKYQEFITQFPSLIKNDDNKTPQRKPMVHKSHFKQLRELALQPVILQKFLESLRKKSIKKIDVPVTILFVNTAKKERVPSLVETKTINDKRSLNKSGVDVRIMLTEDYGIYLEQLSFIDTEGGYSYFGQLAAQFAKNENFDWLIFQLRKTYEMQANIHLVRKEINGRLVSVFDRRRNIPLSTRKNAEHPLMALINVLLTAAVLVEQCLRMFNFSHWPLSVKDQQSEKQILHQNGINLLAGLIVSATKNESLLVQSPQQALVAFANELKSLFTGHLKLELSDEAFNDFVVLAYGLWSACQAPEEKIHIFLDNSATSKIIMRVQPILERAQTHSDILQTIIKDFETKPYEDNKLLQQHFNKSKLQTPISMWLLQCCLPEIKGVISPTLQKFTDLFPKHSYLVETTITKIDGLETKHFAFTLIRTGAPGSQFQAKNAKKVISSKDTKSRRTSIREASLTNTEMIFNCCAEKTSLLMSLNFKITGVGSLAPKYGHEPLLVTEALNMGKFIPDSFGIIVPSVDEGFGKHVANTVPDLLQFLEFFKSKGIVLDLDEKFFPGRSGKNLVDRVVLGAQLAILFMLGIWNWQDSQIKKHFPKKFADRSELYNHYFLPLLCGRLPATENILTQEESTLLLTWIKQSLPLTLFIVHCLAGKDRTTIMHMYVQTLLQGFVTLCWGDHNALLSLSNNARLNDCIAELFVNFIGYVYPGTNGFLSSAYPEYPKGFLILNTITRRHFQLASAERYRKTIKPLETKTKISIDSEPVIIVREDVIYSLLNMLRLRIHFSKLLMLQRFAEIRSLLLTEQDDKKIKLILHAIGIADCNSCPDYLYSALSLDLRKYYHHFESKELENLINHYQDLNAAPHDHIIRFLAEMLAVSVQDVALHPVPLNRPDNAAMIDDFVHILLPALRVLRQNRQGQWLLYSRSAEEIWNSLKQFLTESYEYNGIFNDSNGTLHGEWKAIFAKLETIKTPLVLIKEIICQREPLVERLLAIALGFVLPINDEPLPFKDMRELSSPLPELVRTFYFAEWTYVCAVINTHLLDGPIDDRKAQQKRTDVRAYYSDWRKITVLGWLLQNVRAINVVASDFFRLQFPCRKDCIPVPLPEEDQVLVQYAALPDGLVSIITQEYEIIVDDSIKDITDFGQAAVCYKSGMTFYTQTNDYKSRSSITASSALDLSVIFYKLFIPDFCFIYKLFSSLKKVPENFSQKLLTEFFSAKSKNYALKPNTFISDQKLQEMKFEESVDSQVKDLLEQWQQPITVSAKISSWEQVINDNFAKLANKKYISIDVIKNCICEPLKSRAFYLLSRYESKSSLSTPIDKRTQLYQDKITSYLFQNNSTKTHHILMEWLKTIFEREWLNSIPNKNKNDFLIIFIRGFFNSIGYKFKKGSEMVSGHKFWTNIKLAPLAVFLQYLAWYCKSNASYALHLFIEVANADLTYLNGCLLSDQNYLIQNAKMFIREILHKNKKTTSEYDPTVLQNCWQQKHKAIRLENCEQRVMLRIIYCLNLILDNCVFNRDIRINQDASVLKKLTTSVEGYLQLMETIALEFNEYSIINDVKLIRAVISINKKQSTVGDIKDHASLIAGILRKKFKSNEVKIKQFLDGVWLHEEKSSSPSFATSFFALPSLGSSKHVTLSQSDRKSSSISLTSADPTPVSTSFFSLKKDETEPVVSSILSTSKLAPQDVTIMTCINKILQKCDADLVLEPQPDVCGFATLCASLLETIATMFKAETLLSHINKTKAPATPGTPSVALIT